MVKILNCYLYAKKVIALCLRVQFFWPSRYISLLQNSKVYLLNFLFVYTEYLYNIFSGVTKVRAVRAKLRKTPMTENNEFADRG